MTKKNVLGFIINYYYAKFAEHLVWLLFLNQNCPLNGNPEAQAHAFLFSWFLINNLVRIHGSPNQKQEKLTPTSTRYDNNIWWGHISRS